MTKGMAARWIQRLDQYSFIIEHRRREKHQNADGLSKKTEHYVHREILEEEPPGQVDSFRFLADTAQFAEIPDYEEVDQVEEKETYALMVWEDPDPSELDVSLTEKGDRDWNMASNFIAHDDTNQTYKMARELAAHRHTIKDLAQAQKEDLPILMIRQLMKDNKVQLDCDERMALKLKNFFCKNKAVLFVDKNEVLMRHRRWKEQQDAHLYSDVIILPQVYHMEVRRMTHDHLGHVGQEKTQQMAAIAFDWPGQRKNM